MLPFLCFGGIVQSPMERIDRYASDEEVLYSHFYHYDQNGDLISETLPFDLGEVFYEKGKTTSPFHAEIWKKDDRGYVISHAIDGENREYTYTADGELQVFPEEIDYEYNEKGDLISLGDVQFFYDENHLLTKAETPLHEVEFEYNTQGERIARIVDGKREDFLIHNGNDYAILVDGTVKEVRIPGRSSHLDILKPIAIETKEAVFVPIFDCMGNIIKLINGETKEVIELERAGPFGKGLSKNSPTSWIFANKHYDKELDLIYFGARFYSPKIHKWLTPDPALQSDDLYHYCFNNPFYYMDPDGRAAFAIPIISIFFGGAGAVFTVPMLTAVGAGSAIGYGLYKSYEYLQKKRKERLDNDNAPPYTWDDLGDDATKSPGKDFRWKGRGTPRSGKGS
jgi:RHS repeat-associated protein